MDTSEQMSRSYHMVQDASTKKEIKLKAKLSMMNGISIIVGSIIGAGIFVSPNGVFKEAGSVGMTFSIWILSGLFSAIGAYCYVELGLLIRKSGADYTYIYDGFGPFVGFVRLWVDCIIARPGIITIVALAYGEYVLKPFYLDCDVPDGPKKLLAAGAILLLAFVNCWSVRMATRVQDLVTFSTVLAVLVIVMTGAVKWFSGDVKYENFTNIWEGTQTDLPRLSIGAYQCLFAYFGWNLLNFVIEELKVSNAY